MFWNFLTNIAERILLVKQCFVTQMFVQQCLIVWPGLLWSVANSLDGLFFLAPRLCNSILLSINFFLNWWILFYFKGKKRKIFLPFSWGTCRPFCQCSTCWILFWSKLIVWSMTPCYFLLLSVNLCYSLLLSITFCHSPLLSVNFCYSLLLSLLHVVNLVIFYYFTW